MKKAIDLVLSCSIAFSFYRLAIIPTAVLIMINLVRALVRYYGED